MVLVCFGEGVAGELDLLLSRNNGLQNPQEWGGEEGNKGVLLLDLLISNDWDGKEQTVWETGFPTPILADLIGPWPDAY